MNILPDRHLHHVADIENLAAVPEPFTPARFDEALGLLRPLPLPEVLSRVDVLHASCVGGGHLCGLPARLIKFDLFAHFIALLRAYRVAQQEAA
jgi:hypothetical protein